MLTGGTGLDVFRFTTAPTANRDTITDFSVADDTLQLENAVFKKLATPVLLKAANFVKAGAAHDLNDYLVYNPATGVLSYDADGSGASAGVQIALLWVNLALTDADVSNSKAMVQRAVNNYSQAFKQPGSNLIKLIVNRHRWTR